MEGAFAVEYRRAACDWRPVTRDMYFRELLGPFALTRLRMIIAGEFEVVLLVTLRVCHDRKVSDAIPD